MPYNNIDLGDFTRRVWQGVDKSRDRGDNGASHYSVRFKQDS